MCALGYYELYNTVCAKLKDYLCEFFVSLVDTKRFAAFTKLTQTRQFIVKTLQRTQTEKLFM